MGADCISSYTIRFLLLILLNGRLFGGARGLNVKVPQKGYHPLKIQCGMVSHWTISAAGFQDEQFLTFIVTQDILA